MGVAFRELPVGRSRWRLPQSRDRGLQGSTHCGYCVHGSHLLPMDHDRQDASTPATRCAIGIMPVAVSLSNAPPTATPSSVMGQFGRGERKQATLRHLNVPAILPAGDRGYGGGALVATGYTSPGYWRMTRSSSSAVIGRPVRLRHSSSAPAIHSRRSRTLRRGRCTTGEHGQVAQTGEAPRTGLRELRATETRRRKQLGEVQARAADVRTRLATLRAVVASAVPGPGRVDPFDIIA